MAPPSKHQTGEIPISWFSAITTYLGYALLTVVGHIRDFLAKLTGWSRYKTQTPPGYAPMFNDWENFYTRRAYHRCHDCWNLPIGGPPTASNMLVMQRTSNDGCRTMRCANSNVLCTFACACVRSRITTA